MTAQVLQALALDEHPVAGFRLGHDVEARAAPRRAGGPLGLEAHCPRVAGTDARKRQTGAVDEWSENVDRQCRGGEARTELRACPTLASDELAAVASRELLADGRPLVGPEGGYEVVLGLCAPTGRVDDAGH